MRPFSGRKVTRGTNGPVRDQPNVRCVGEVRRPRPSNPERVIPSRRQLVVGALAAAAALGYAVAPLATAAPQRPAMVLGHVPTDPSPLTGAVVVGPGGATVGYDTKVVVITQGMPLTFINLDELAHTVTSVARDASGRALFSGNALPGTTSEVTGTAALAPGTYAFFCQFHPNM